MEKEIFNGFLESFYKNNFESLIRKNAEAKGQEPDAKLEKVLRTVFFSVFKHYSPARRVELFLAITERMREVRLQGKELNAGQAVRLFLEQIGVVGIKAGQTVAEQKSLVNDDIRGELSSLRDRATPFSKFGVFTYLRLGGLMGQRQAADRPAPFQIAQVGECLGSASIKQAHWAKTTEGADVVPKVPRPTIDKNHEEDTYVLGQVFEDLRNEGINFPQHLLHEIIDACASEFDFGQEGETQQAMDANLYARRAKVSLVDKNGAAETVRLDVPDLLFMLRRGDSSVANLQLMVDEGIRGFSIKEVEEWQALTATTAPSPEEQARKEELGLKLEKQYKEYAALVGMEYAGIDMRMLRAQLAMDWITQVMDDGLFHADLHAGNTLVDLTPKRKRVCYIDFGSSGRSVERRASDTVDHRQSFKEFLQSIILMKIGAGNSAERLAGIIARYVEVEGRDQKFWQEKVTQLQQAQPEIGHFFKDLLGEILGEHGKVDRQFKMLLKGLAAGGGHFEALSEQLALSMFQAMQESLKTGVPVGTVVSRQGGFLRQLLPLVEGLPEIQTVLQYSPEDSLRSMAEGLDIGYVVVTGNQVWLAQNPGEAGGAPKSGLVEFNANGTILTGPDGATFDLLHIRYDGPNGLYEYLRRVGTV